MSQPARVQRHGRLRRQRRLRSVYLFLTLPLTIILPQVYWLDNLADTTASQHAEQWSKSPISAGAYAKAVTLDRFMLPASSSCCATLVASKCVTYTSGLGTRGSHVISLIFRLLAAWGMKKPLWEQWFREQRGRVRIAGLMLRKWRGPVIIWLVSLLKRIFADMERC